MGIGAYAVTVLYLTITLLVAGLEKAVLSRSMRRRRLTSYGEVLLAVTVASGLVPVVGAAALLIVFSLFLGVHVVAAKRGTECACFSRGTEPISGLAAAALRWCIALACLLTAPHTRSVPLWEHAILGLPIYGGLLVFGIRFVRLRACYVQVQRRFMEGNHAHA